MWHAEVKGGGCGDGWRQKIGRSVAAEYNSNRYTNASGLTGRDGGNLGQRACLENVKWHAAVEYQSVTVLPRLA